MANYQFRARSAASGDYNFTAYRLDFLPDTSDVKKDVDRGDSVLGTYDATTGVFVSSSGSAYDKKAYNADKSIRKSGQSITITNTVQGDYDPATSKVTNTTLVQDGIGVITGWSNKFVDGSMIKHSDKKLLLSPLNTAGEYLVAPLLGSKITDAAGITYTIVAPLQPLSPGGTTVLYTLNMRA